MNRYIRLAFTAALVVSLGVLVGCGGGGGGPTPVTPIIRPDVTVLATDGSVTITEQTDTTVTLSGSVPTLQPGSVLVSGAGQGLLRRVVSTSQEGENTVVQTAPATLEDVFQQVDIQLQKTLGPSDFEVMEPALPGVTIEPERSPDKNARQSLRLVVRLANVRLYGTDGASVELNGTLFISVEIDVRIQLGWTGVKYVRFVPTFSTEGSVAVTGKATFLRLKQKTGHLVGIPITVWAGVPVVFVPVIDLYMTLDGQVIVGGELTSGLSLSLGAGLEYHRGRGWDIIQQATHNVHLLPTGNFFVGFSVGWTPDRSELSLLIYGVTGPYASLDLPRLDISGRLQTNPAGFKLEAGPVLRGSVGWKAEILGWDIASVDYPNALELRLNVIDFFFPFSGELELGIE